MTDDDWLEACDQIMEALVDAGCTGCHVSATLGTRQVEFGLWNGDVETVLELLTLGLEAKQGACDGPR